MGVRIFCSNCGHFKSPHHCKFREIFIKPNRARFCQDFVDKTILKPKEEVPQPVKPLEEVPVVPIKTQLELCPKEVKPEIKKVSLIRRILNYLIRRFKWLMEKK